MDKDKNMKTSKYFFSYIIKAVLICSLIIVGIYFALKYFLFLESSRRHKKRYFTTVECSNNNRFISIQTAQKKGNKMVVMDLNYKPHKKRAIRWSLWI